MRIVLTSTVMVLSVAACAGQSPSVTQQRTSVKPQENALFSPLRASDAATWFAQGRDKVMRNRGLFGNVLGAKNVILFVGDGMGVSTVTAARILAGQQAGSAGEEHFLSFEQFPHLALSKTFNTNLQTPDSAGTMSAMMTGVKTKAGVISVDQDIRKSDCSTQAGNERVSVLELAELAGMRTGVISTARLTHATPAATYAKSVERGWESDADIPAEQQGKGCRDIARQLIEFNVGDGIEVAMGGGRRGFIPETMADPEDSDQTGSRADGQDLTKAWTQRHANAAYVWNQAGFDAVDPAKTEHLLGLFERSHLEYEADRADDAGGEPSIAEMTVKALDILQRGDDGFFLMVEGGRIDHAHHGGNAYRALHDALAFDQAVQAALDKVNLSETLIVVTADHSHVFVMSGYPARGNPILGKVKSVDRQGTPSDDYSMDSRGYPYTTLGYYNGPGWRNAEDAAKIKDDDSQHKDFQQIAGIPKGSETHGGEDVAIYAVGPGAQGINGVMEQNAIYHALVIAVPALFKAEQSLIGAEGLPDWSLVGGAK